MRLLLFNVRGKPSFDEALRDFVVWETWSHSDVKPMRLLLFNVRGKTSLDEALRFCSLGNLESQRPEAHEALQDFVVLETWSHSDLKPMRLLLFNVRGKTSFDEALRDLSFDEALRDFVVWETWTHSDLKQLN